MTSNSYSHDSEQGVRNKEICVHIDEHLMGILARYLLQNYIQKSCFSNAQKIIQNSQFVSPPSFPKTPVSRRLSLSEKREWYSPRDIEEIYGLSRKTLELIRHDAKKKGIPLEVSEMAFKNGSKSDRRRPFIRISRKSIEVYLQAHFITEQ